MMTSHLLWGVAPYQCPLGVLGHTRRQLWHSSLYMSAMLPPPVWAAFGNSASTKIIRNPSGCVGTCSVGTWGMMCQHMVNYISLGEFRDKNWLETAYSGRWTLKTATISFDNHFGYCFYVSRRKWSILYKHFFLFYEFSHKWWIIIFRENTLEKVEYGYSILLDVYVTAPSASHNFHSCCIFC